LREKVLAQASAREVIVVDDSKLSDCLGTQRALPVEVVTFGWRTQSSYLETLGARVEARRAADGSTFLTDQGNMILDCSFGRMLSLEQLSSQLHARAGIVEHGLFIGLATDLISAGEGGIRHVTREAHTGRMQ
jgi:ribose 5-phosphate isomerase A